MPRQQVSLYNFFQYCYVHQLPVAFYRLPQTKSIRVVAQNNSRLHRVKPLNSGFIFAPFTKHTGCSEVFIKADIDCRSTQLPALDFAQQSKIIKQRLLPYPLSTTKLEYTTLVKAIKQQIKTDGLQKAVAARVSIEQQPKGFSAVAFFENLCAAYTHAFISLVYTPLTGVWIGATPELLLSAEKGKVSTYSLAGTRANSRQNTNLPWGEKESTEQQIVSHYIRATFKKVTPIEPKIKGPETIAAANLLHLRTTFTYAGISGNRWKEIANKLHPTPAIAGLPKRKAIHFILKYEKNAREYYSGYLGPISSNNEVKLFVNLRCMKVVKDKLVIYTGCGITKDSIPASEWQETEIKKQTLLNVLKGTIAP